MDTMAKPMPEPLRIGNLPHQRLEGALTAANGNRFIRVLAKSGPPTLASNLGVESIQDLQADHFHEACWKVIGSHRCPCPSSPRLNP